MWITLILVVSTLGGPKESYIYKADTLRACEQMKGELINRLKDDPGKDIHFLDCTIGREEFR